MAVESGIGGRIDLPKAQPGYHYKGHAFVSRPLFSERMVCLNCGFGTTYCTLRSDGFHGGIPACEHAHTR